MFTARRTSTHRGHDDLLTAGLGSGGLRAMIPPPYADPARPTAEELRRRAIWSSWRGIADLAPGGGFGRLYGSTSTVPGREFHAYATLPGARHPHRVMLQLPDGFDPRRPRLLVTAASGSRGIYGSVALASAWGLPRGWAVVHTDKAAGSDYFDLDSGTGCLSDGTRAPAGTPGLAFEPDPADGGGHGVRGIAVKHAHSKDNPEADWGRHVRQAAEFALQVLAEAYPEHAPFTFDGTRIVATGISNGGGAVLRAAEGDDRWLDAVVAGEPNVYADAPGARCLYDYATEAALLMPCEQLLPQELPASLMAALAAPQLAGLCARLAADGLVEGATPACQARSAHERLLAAGWTVPALRAGALSTGFDMWRALAVTYASAYGRHGVDGHPCGYRFAAQHLDLSPRPATAVERAAWWSEASGLPPGQGIGIVDPSFAPPGFGFPGLRRLRALWEGDDADARRVQAGIAATRARPPREGLPVVVVHGIDDGLIPIAFSSAPYVEAARAAGRDVRFWQVRHAQHFDSFLGLPDLATRYVPLLPYVHAALDRVAAFLEGEGALPGDAVVEPTPRAPGQRLEAWHLAIP
jgi:hydroxybutyrate-dimer hydrolase